MRQITVITAHTVSNFFFLKNEEADCACIALDDAFKGRAEFAEFNAIGGVAAFRGSSIIGYIVKDNDAADPEETQVYVRQVLESKSRERAAEEATKKSLGF